ncbi:MAG: M3 family metallopeptidase [Bacteroidales bacterium]|nr:M3 family metallopeptidase [Bacteroidales bacterium]
MKRIVLLLIPGILLLNACKKQNKAESENPFIAGWDTPFGVPPFDRIENEHYLPAFEEGIRQHEAEIDAILSNTEDATFDNTILPFDKSGDLLSKVANVFFNLTEANTSDEMQSLAREIAPMISAHRDNITMNDALFNRISQVYEKRNASGLDKSQIRVVEKMHESFVRNGANLSGEDKEKLRRLNEELTRLSLKFGQNLLAETNESYKLVIDNEEDLAGLPENVITGAKEAALADSLEGKWLFTLHKPSWIPFLQYSEKRDLREKIYRGYCMRGNNDNAYDNKEIIRKIVALRAVKAELLGFENHAAYKIDINMAKTPETVYDFLYRLWDPALKRAKQEVKDMQAMIDAEGGKFRLTPADWWYYAEKVRKQKYDLDESQLKPYFKLEHVREGMFWVASQLYGITFTRLENVPVYHPGVEVYEVKEADGTHTGLLYLDYFPRESKSGGAWCTTFRDAKYRDGEKIAPVVSIVCNATKPAGDIPSLLSWDDVTTLFHEFGHALHALFTDGQYDQTAGRVPRDFVELPSQIMENWASEPAVLKHYARHYQTGETIPDELIEKIQKSGQFNQGFETVEYLAASLLDLDYHMLEPGDSITDVLVFEKQAMDRIGLIDEIIPRYRSTYFAHAFEGGYDAGYYVYIWADVLDTDAFDAFKQSGDIFNKELAARFRKYCLAGGGDDEGMVQYRLFRGQDPSVEPLLIKRGLK